MSLEQLIEACQEARLAYDYCKDDCGQAMDNLIEAEDAIVNFVMRHPDELIAWERQNALRTSPFDEDVQS